MDAFNNYIGKMVICDKLGKHFLCCSLLYCKTAIVIHISQKICANRLYVFLVRLLVNRRQFIVKFGGRFSTAWEVGASTPA